MKFYTSKGSHIVELLSIVFFTWCIGFLIFFLGGLFLSQKMGIIEGHEDYSKRVKQYVEENTETIKYEDFMKGRKSADEFMQARDNYLKASEENRDKSNKLKQQYEEENPMKSFDERYIILLVGILPGIFTILICKKYYDNLVTSIEIIDDSIILTKNNKKVKTYKLSDYLLQLYTVTMISWKHLFIPYKLYTLNLLDQNGKQMDSIYLSELMKKDLDVVLKFIEDYQDEHQN